MIARLPLFLLFLLSFAGFSQSGTWVTLPNAPVVSRHNDLYFVNADRGWIVNGNGEIYRTTDGGDSWALQFNKPDAHFRSIGFLNDQDGWAGNVGFGEFGATDSIPFYHTTNGGQNWQAFDTFSGPQPVGICGMEVYDANIINAVGRVRGPAFFVRTTDGGQSWISRDMSAYAAGLIDVHFVSPDSGFAVGLSNANHNQSSGVILFTADGGNSWEIRHTSARTGEWCWKISFPSRRVGYASLQRNSLSPIYFLKTTDGGQTWSSELFRDAYYFVQGLGFVDEMNGWIGGNSSEPSFFTTDGGVTWASADFGSRMNRVRFLGDTLGYAVGQTVYKYTANPTAIGRPAATIPTTVELAQNYPNPFNPTTTIRYYSAGASHLRLEIFNVEGKRIGVLLDGTVAPGWHSVVWDGQLATGQEAPSGIYFYRLSDAGARSHLTQKMMLIR